jgi:gas vesicle protein
LTKRQTHQATIKDLRAENVVLTANVKTFEDQSIHLSKENAELRADNYKLTKVANLHKEICTKLETAAKQNKELTSKVAELQAEKEQETNRLMQEIERIVEEKSKLVEENLRFLGSNLDDIPLEELRSLELEIRGIHQNIQRAKVSHSTRLTTIISN